MNRKDENSADENKSSRGSESKRARREPVGGRRAGETHRWMDVMDVMDSQDINQLSEAFIAHKLLVK